MEAKTVTDIRRITPSSTAFGEWVADYRKEKGWTQAKLARCLPCQPGYIGRIERNEQRPGADLAMQLAERLDVPADQQALFLQLARSELPAHVAQGVRAGISEAYRADAAQPATQAEVPQQAWIICVPTPAGTDPATLLETIATVIRGQSNGDEFHARAS